MIRMLIGGLIGATFAFSLLGCGKGSPRDISDWSYNPPEGFKQQDKQVKGATVFLGPRQDNFTANLQVLAGTNTAQTAKQIGESALGKITGSGGGVTVKEQEEYKIPDSDAYTWLVSKQLKNGNVAGQRQFVIMKNGIVVLFTMTASDKAMPQCDQALADSLQSFKWGR